MTSSVFFSSPNLSPSSYHRDSGKPHLFNKSMISIRLSSSIKNEKIGQRLDILTKNMFSGFLSHVIRLYLVPTRSQGGDQYSASYPIRNRLEGKGKLDNSIIIILYPFRLLLFLYGVCTSVCLGRLCCISRKGVTQQRARLLPMGVV